MIMIVIRLPVGVVIEPRWARVVKSIILILSVRALIIVPVVTVVRAILSVLSVPVKIRFVIILPCLIITLRLLYVVGSFRIVF